METFEALFAKWLRKVSKRIRFFTKSHRPFCIFLHFTISAISRKAFSHSLLPLGQFCCILQFPLSVFLFLSFIFLLEIWPPSFLRGPPFQPESRWITPYVPATGGPPLLLGSLPHGNYSLGSLSVQEILRFLSNIT